MSKPELRTLFDLTDAQLRPMTKEESSIFVTLSLAHHKKPSKIVKGRELLSEFCLHYGISHDKITDDDFKQLAETGKVPFQLAVGLMRCAHSDPDGEFDLDMCAWAFTGLADRVAVVVLWAYALVKGRKKLNGQAITLDNWAKVLHPWGVPTNEALFELWDEQKGYKLGLKCDNYLDSAEAWT